MGLVSKKDDQKLGFLVPPSPPQPSKNYNQCWWAESGVFCPPVSPPSPPNNSTTTPIINTVHHPCFLQERGNMRQKQPKLTHPPLRKAARSPLHPPESITRQSDFFKSLAPCVGGRFQHSDGARDLKNS